VCYNFKGVVVINKCLFSVNFHVHSLIFKLCLCNPTTKLLQIYAYGGGPLFTLGSLLFYVAWVIKIMHSCTNRTRCWEVKVRQVVGIFRYQLVIMPQIWFEVLDVWERSPPHQCLVMFCVVLPSWWWSSELRLCILEEFGWHNWGRCFRLSYASTHINGSAIDSIEQECKIILKATVAQVSLGCHCRMVAHVEDAVKSTDRTWLWGSIVCSCLIIRWIVRRC
jgi:hypothetical protein